MRFSSAYEMKVEMTCEAPGIMPSANPIIVPRPIGPAASLRSDSRGTRSRSFGWIGLTSLPASKLSRISLIPNSPIAKATKLTPSVRSSWPKVKRGSAVNGSRPIVPIARPSVIMMNVFSGGPPEMKPRTSSASSIRMNSAGGPTLSMTSASGGANSMSPTMLIVPAKKLPTAAIMRAGPARPLRAIS